MSILIIDASVAIKWFVPEVHSGEAKLWRHGPHELHVPEALFPTEFANIVWKKLIRSELTRQDADDIFAQTKTLPLIPHRDLPLISPAFDIAAQYKRSVYDAVYLALAQQLNGQMLTADERLINALRGTSLATLVRHVADLTTP